MSAQQTADAQLAAQLAALTGATDMQDANNAFLTAATLQAAGIDINSLVAAQSAFQGNLSCSFTQVSMSWLSLRLFYLILLISDPNMCIFNTQQYAFYDFLQ